MLQAIDRIPKVQERRAKLAGLDAPRKVEILSMDTIDAEIQRLENLLGLGDRSASEKRL